MTGAFILNAVQFAALAAYANNDRHLTKAYLLDGIRKEYLKDEKTI